MNKTCPGLFLLGWLKKLNSNLLKRS